LNDQVTVWPWMIWMTGGWNRLPQRHLGGADHRGSVARVGQQLDHHHGGDGDGGHGGQQDQPPNLVARLMKRACLDPARQGGLPTGGGKAGTLCHVATGR
jgi:hypothetical protein